ncbi:MAG: cell division protein SepF [Syntrophaceticus sp.]
MARSLFDKVINFLGYSEQDDEFESLEDFEDRFDGSEDETRGRKRAPVLNLHTSPEVKIIVMTPGSFNEAEKIANHLKSRKPVVVNLSEVSKEVAQRILDFMGGTVFALNGNMQKVSKNTFLFVPSNMTVYSDTPDALAHDKFIAKLERDRAHDC